MKLEPRHLRILRRLRDLGGWQYADRIAGPGADGRTVAPLLVALHRAGLVECAEGERRTVAFCEVEPFCRAVLEHHWPGVPIFEDVRTLRGSDVGAVDLVAGGFPCQPVSVAGRRKGEADERWLWPEMLRIVREVRPRWVLAENVPGLRTLGADRVLEDLEAEGYACWPLVVGADDVGAPHRRKRVWIVAHRGHIQPKESSGSDGIGGERPEEWRRELINIGSGASRVPVPAPGVATDERTVAGAAKAGSPALAHGDSAGRSAERSSGLLDGERQASRYDADGCGVGPVAYASRDGEGGVRSAAGTERERTWASGGPVGEPTGRGLAGPGGSDAGSLPAAPALRWPARPGEPQHPWEEPRLVAHSESRRNERPSEPAGAQLQPDSRNSARKSRGAQQPLGLPASGLPERLVRRANREALRALGNAVVSQVVEQIGRAIIAAEARMRYAS